MGEAMQMGEGERLEAARRRRFWRIVSWLALTGFAAGLLFGGTFAVLGDTSPTMAGLPPPAIIAAVAVTLALFLYGTWRFFRSVDELELDDNLWSSLIGFYTYTTLFPFWWLLWRAGVSPEPDDWAIFGVTIASFTAAYLWRKWRAR